MSKKALAKLKAELLPDEETLQARAAELYAQRFEGRYQRHEEQFPFWELEVRDYCYLHVCLGELADQEKTEQREGKNVFFLKDGDKAAYKHPRQALMILLRTQKQRIVKQLGFAPLEKRAARASSAREAGKAAALAAMRDDD